MAWPSLYARTKDWGTEVLTDADLEGALDLIGDYINDMMNSSTGHKHDGTTAEGPKITTANIDDSAGTAGDVYTNSGGTTVSRLALGTANQVLAVNAGATAVEYQTVNGDQSQDGSIVQIVNTTTGALATGTGTFTNNDTIPTTSNGTQYMSLSITPRSVTNKLLISVVFNGAFNGQANHLVAALFQTVGTGSSVNAIATAVDASAFTDGSINMAFNHFMTSPSTGAITFTVRVGATGAGTVTFNGAAAARQFGGVMASSITITEIKDS